MIEAFLARAMLAGLRIGGLMTFAPFFGNASLPNQAKAGLTIALTALLLPAYSAGAMATPDHIGNWAALALSEIAIGMLIGYSTQLVFEGMELAGQIVGFQFGFSLVNVIDPNSQVEVTVLSSFHELIALLLFMQLGVQRWLLRATAASFRLIPIGSFARHVPGPAFLRAATAMWLIGAEIAFPVVIGTMVLDLTVGFLAKAAPQFPALFFGISAKYLMGLAVLYGTIAFWPSLLEKYFMHALRTLERLLEMAS